MVIAGRDTTAQALSWAFYRLCLHKNIQDLVRKEVLEEVKKAHGAANNDKFTIALSYECLQQMKYLEAFCMEVLRLYPSVPKEAKSAFNDDTLPDGTKVMKNDIVCFTPWIMGRSTLLWGDDALDFKPERFFNAPKPSPFIFTAFQAGPRTCLGQNFAMLEMKCVLARLLLCYDFTLAEDPTKVTYENSLTLPIKGGLQVTVTKL
jgi:cytochrome P450